MARRRGKILAIKLGVNPNSSSLGADVTLLLFGAAALSMLTPLVSGLLRWRGAVGDRRVTEAESPPPPGADS